MCVLLVCLYDMCMCVFLYVSIMYICVVLRIVPRVSNVLNIHTATKLYLKPIFKCFVRTDDLNFLPENHDRRDCVPPRVCSLYLLTSAEACPCPYPYSEKSCFSCLEIQRFRIKGYLMTLNQVGRSGRFLDFLGLCWRVMGGLWEDQVTFYLYKVWEAWQIDPAVTKLYSAVPRLAGSRLLFAYRQKQNRPSHPLSSLSGPCQGQQYHPSPLCQQLR